MILGAFRSSDPIYILDVQSFRMICLATEIYGHLGIKKGSNPVKLETEGGRVVIDALDLAPLLGCQPSEVPGLMRQGKITSVFEQGEGEDAGRFRVTFRFRATRVRFTCAEDGTVLSQIRTSGAGGP